MLKRYKSNTVVVMLDISVSLGALLTIAKWATGGVWNIIKGIPLWRLKDPTAPKNIISNLLPGKTRKFVEEKFGAPHVETNFCDYIIVSYIFSNALVQIDYKENSVFSVILISLYHGVNTKFPLNKFREFEIPYINKSIGKNTFHDVFPEPNLIAKMEYSSKFFILWQKKFYGNPGRYLVYQFGAAQIDSICSVPFSLPEYKKLTEDTCPSVEIIDKKVKKFNSIRITKECEENIDSFGYFHGIFP